MSRAHSSATLRNINASDGHDGSYIYLFVRLARGLITAAHYPNCRHFLARHGSPSSSYARLLATPFATGGGLRKFMAFLHEITRKHNPCPLRRMSPRRAAVPFLSPACTARLSLLLSPLFPPHFIRASARFCWSLERETCFTEFDLRVLALAHT